MNRSMETFARRGLRAWLCMSVLLLILSACGGGGGGGGGNGNTGSTDCILDTSAKLDTFKLG